mgnify:CR=1 FL=1
MCPFPTKIRILSYAQYPFIKSKVTYPMTYLPELLTLAGLMSGAIVVLILTVFYFLRQNRSQS